LNLSEEKMPLSIRALTRHEFFIVNNTSVQASPLRKVKAHNILPRVKLFYFNSDVASLLTIQKIIAGH